MINLVQSAKRQIVSRLKLAFSKGLEDGSFTEELLSEPAVEVPKEKEHGDFATNICMQAAKQLKMPPIKIAQVILDKLSLEGSYFCEAKMAGPGFINFYFGEKFYSDVLTHIAKEAEDYGKTPYGMGKSVVVEFVSANPTGPMHIGNARGGAIGDCLSEVLSWAGYDVTREFYINDAGNQIEKFFASLDARYIQATCGEDAIAFPEDGYHGDDIKERVLEYIALHGDDLVGKSVEERKAALVPFALQKNIAGLKSDLESYRIHYDVWFSESSLYEKGEVEETLKILKEHGATYEKDGAIWFEATKFGCDKDEVLVRANGLCTYFAADIAYHRNKILKRNFERCINIWGADHHGHVARLKAALDAVGLSGMKLHVVLMQLVRLVSNGEAVKVSKRSGKAIALRELLDEVGIDAARFFFNLRQSDSHLEFDLELAVEQSSQNPVYYVQYAHARICSVLNLLRQQGVAIKTPDQANMALLKQKEETELISKLADFPEEIKTAAESYDPSRVTRYVIDLASLFHKFYNAHKVNCADSALRDARVVLCDCVRVVLKNALTVLSVDAPERM